MGHQQQEICYVCPSHIVSEVASSVSNGMALVEGVLYIMVVIGMNLTVQILCIQALKIN